MGFSTSSENGEWWTDHGRGGFCLGCDGLGW